MNFKCLFKNIIFGVIPLALLMVIVVFTQPESALFKATNSIYAVILTILYWVLFAVLWSALTVLLFHLGKWIRKILRIK